MHNNHLLLIHENAENIYLYFGGVKFKIFIWKFRLNDGLKGFCKNLSQNSSECLIGKSMKMVITQAQDATYQKP